MAFADKERHAQPVFKQADLLADCAGRDAQRLGRRFQAAQAASLGEGSQSKQGQHGSHGIP
ncbi:hypothetical protein D3C85_1528470 [compost metagenome]